MTTVEATDAALAAVAAVAMIDVGVAAAVLHAMEAHAVVVHEMVPPAAVTVVPAAAMTRGVPVAHPAAVVVGMVDAVVVERAVAALGGRTRVVATSVVAETSGVVGTPTASVMVVVNALGATVVIGTLRVDAIARTARVHRGDADVGPGLEWERVLIVGVDLARIAVAARTMVVARIAVAARMMTGVRPVGVGPIVEHVPVVVVARMVAVARMVVVARTGTNEAGAMIDRAGVNRQRCPGPSPRLPGCNAAATSRTLRRGSTWAACRSPYGQS